MTPEAKVYITNDSGLDFSKAEKFGQLVKLTNGPVDVFRPHMIQREVESNIKQFDRSLDYLLVAGAALPVGFAFAWLCVEEGGTVKLLIFDAKKADYMVRTIEL